ncbi:MAG: DNA primase [bacterium]
MDFDELKYRIKTENPIESVVRDYVELRRAGRNLKALCPFHDEKTPSFMVSPDKGFYHCFGCKASGDVIKFVQDIEHISFMEAVELLAERAGIDISQFKGRFSTGDTEDIYEANERAMMYYNKAIKYNREAYNYLQNRGITKRDIDRYRLGYADYDNPLVKHIKSEKWDFSQFEKAGLIMKNNNQYRDRFYGRIMFPISNHMNKIIGFGGRILKGNGPKYINSAENKVFKKGNFLYGLNIAKKSIYDAQSAILTEGYMDFIALHKTGIVNTVAQLGTACTENQSKLLARMAEKIIIMYDGDDAGRDAAFRSIPILLKNNLSVEVFVYEEYSDPDELASSKSIDMDYINSHSVNFIEYVLSNYKTDVTDPLLREKHAVSYIIKAINSIEDTVLRELYQKRAARKLKISMNLFGTSGKKPVKKNRPVRSESEASDLYIETISMMLSSDETGKKFCEELEDSEFRDIKTKGFFAEICNTLHDEGHVDAREMIENNSKDELKNRLLERTLYYTDKRPSDKKINTYIHLIRKHTVMKKLEETERKRKHIKDKEEIKRLDELIILLRKKLM